MFQKHSAPTSLLWVDALARWSLIKAHKENRKALQNLIREDNTFQKEKFLLLPYADLCHLV